MSTRQKLLVLDDDLDFLEIYQEMLAGLPSQPEIHTAPTGARALALLESEPFSLLLCDLNMPKMDGLQVLAVVRRKFPDLRTVVMTALVDDQFRLRAYAMGVDLFLEKPGTTEEAKFFLDCVESLLGQKDCSGFRGVQSKSLVDILQLEGLSQSSAVLRITHGQLEGRIWFLNGDIIDAAALDLAGEAAFHKILSWKTGNFEIFPPEPTHPRTIFNSYQSLLLETAQALDEVTGQEQEGATGTDASTVFTTATRLSAIAKFRGIEFVLASSIEDKQHIESWGTENSQQLAAWTRQALQRFNSLGERLHVGQLQQITCSGFQGQCVLVPTANTHLCLGFQKAMSPEQVNETTQKVLTQWES